MHPKHLSLCLCLSLVGTLMPGGLTASRVTVTDGMPLDKVAYKEGKSRVNSLYRADRQGCTRLTGLRQELCMERAAASHRVARAELKYELTGAAGDLSRWKTAQADLGFAAAMEKCLPLTGGAQDACVRRARVGFGRI